MEAFLQKLLLELAAIAVSVALMRLLEWFAQRARGTQPAVEFAVAA